MLAISGFLAKRNGAFQANDDAARRQLAELDRRKGDVIRRAEEIEKKWGVRDVGELERRLSEMENDLSDLQGLYDENDSLSEEMDDVFVDHPDINENDYPNY